MSSKDDTFNIAINWQLLRPGSLTAFLKLGIIGSLMCYQEEEENSIFLAAPRPLQTLAIGSRGLQELY